jgi:lysozyme family protein
MVFSFADTWKGYAHLWDTAKLNPTFAHAADANAARIIALKSTFEPVQQATGVPWWMVGCMLYRESNLDIHTYLGNGQSLSHVTTEVPAGRGPFPSFQAGAEDAIRHEEMTGVPWTLELVLYWLERFNGQGYFGHGNSPYVWSWTTLYKSGKFTSDHHYNPDFVDPQGGCAALMLALFARDPSLTPNREMTPRALPSPVPAPLPKPTGDKTHTGDKTMADVLNEVEGALEGANKILPTIIGVLGTFIPQLRVLTPFLSLLPNVIQAVQAIQTATGADHGAAASAVINHLTPGAPNSPVLSGPAQGGGA